MISVIVPIYKVEQYLAECLDSLVAQTCNELEIILVNDGSPDNCPAICEEYAKKDNRITVLHKENGGLISARQAGVEVARGDYIGFVDGDDWIEPDMFQKITDSINKYHSDIVMCQFVYNHADREETSNYNLCREFYTREQIVSEIIPTMLFNGTYFHFGIYPNCWSKVFKKDLLMQNLMSVDKRTTIGEDTSFTYPCLLDAQSVSFVDDALYHYRINNQSMTKKYDEKLKDVILLPYQVLQNKTTNFNIENQLDYYLLYLVNFVIRNEANANNPNSAKEKKAVLGQFTKNKQLKSAIKRTSYSVLPIQTKVIRFCIVNGLTGCLCAYTEFLKKFM